MGRKKKKASKPWCWYCNREFDDEKILIQHQKAKHFKCHICHKKLYTGPGLSIHCMQVHKEAIDKVPNSIPSRSNIEIEIYGMEGIPPEDVKEHERQKTGGKVSDSDDDEPASKKKALLGAGPSGISPGILPTPGTNIPGTINMMPLVNPMLAPLAPPFIPNMQGTQRMMMQGMRPSFPAASVVPTSTPKPTFPAYSSATISAPPSTSSAGGGAGPSNGEDSESRAGGAGGVATGAPLVTATGAGSRIMHPPEDVSLEEIKARNPKYRGKTRAPEPAPAPSPSLQQHQHLQMQPAATQAEMNMHMSAAAAVAAAQRQAVHAQVAAQAQLQAMRRVPMQLMPGMQGMQAMQSMQGMQAMQSMQGMQGMPAMRPVPVSMPMLMPVMHPHPHMRPMQPGMLMGGMGGMPGMSGVMSMGGMLQAPMFPGGLPLMQPRYR